ncbi:unnamed protein product [Adineta ricciae]|uniref:RNase III domain-containing protein n=1 Tax=Adineta ricciae TaxID=249248 RepID=A0A814R4C6_ADIRI|nr:unnamed protein product [Adineta ricciae]CAF1128898.1 unnamed protein product [Adineta ricciae]
MSRAERLQKFQTACGYTFKNVTLLEEALTHDSNRVNNRDAPTYQRLEFLGDSVLNLVVSEYLYRNNASFTEGQLTTKRSELTNANKQSQIAEKHALKAYILLGQSVSIDQYRGHHCFVESVIGAVYIDGGLEEARKLILKFWGFTDDTNTASSASAGNSCVLS